MRKSHPLLAGIENVKPYKLTEGIELYGMTPPPMQIDQFLPSGGVMGMTSYPGVGKSWLALEVARSVSSGTPFLGRYETIRGGVLFVGSDSSVFDYAQQWRRLTSRTPRAWEVFEPVRFLMQSAFMFEDRDEVRRLIRTHQTFEWGEPSEGAHGPEREQGFHVVVFDTLSRLTRANQNDNTEMEEVFRNIRVFSEATGAACVVLHHNSKRSEFNDGSDWRGAMSQIGALDSWVQLAPARRDKYLVGVQFKKFRGITPSDFSYRMEVGDPEAASLRATDEPVTATQRRTGDPLRKEIVALLEREPLLRASDIRDRLWPAFEAGVRVGEIVHQYPVKLKFTHAVNNKLASLVEDGVLGRTDDAGRPTYNKKAEVKNLTKLVQTSPDLDAVEEALDAEEKPSQSTRTGAPKDTSGTKSERSRGRKSRNRPVRVAKRTIPLQENSTQREDSHPLTGRKSPRR